MNESFESLLEAQIAAEVSRQVEQVRADLEEDFAQQIKDFKTPPVLRTRKDAQDFLHCSAPTLHKLMNEGKLPYLKIGRNTRFKQTDLEKLLKRGRA